MIVIAEIVLPVVLLGLAGFLLARSGLVSEEAVRGLANVTFYILFAALLFRSMAKVRVESLDPAILLAFFSGVALVFIALMLIGRFVLGMRLADQAILALSGSFSNGVGLGIPLVSLAFGEDGLVPLLMIISVHSLIMLTLACFLIEIDLQDHGGIARRMGAAMLTMFKHPVLPAIFAGLAWGELTRRIPGLAMPDVLDKALALAAQAAAPMGLITLGASLAHVGFRGHLREGVLTSVAKLLVLPIVVYLAGRYVFRLESLGLTIAVLNASMPAGANVYMIAQRYNVGIGRSTNAVVLSTVASVFTVSVALALLR
ncbi:MAG: AEC family transporter [Alphaproteobacteria bacterium]|nr:AEC family transporter [Alphaproteobacteria bacterium]